jgi:hypothetical protein
MSEQWVAVAVAGTGWAGEGGPEVEFVSRAVAPRRVTCGMDLSDAGGPLLLTAGASLRACAVEDLAAAFARLCDEVRRSAWEWCWGNRGAAAVFIFIACAVLSEKRGKRCTMR